MGVIEALTEVAQRRLLDRLAELLLGRPGLSTPGAIVALEGTHHVSLTPWLPVTVQKHANTCLHECVAGLCGHLVRGFAWATIFPRLGNADVLVLC